MSLLLLLTSPSEAAAVPEGVTPLDRWLVDTQLVSGTPFATIGVLRPPGRFEQ